MPSKVEPVPTSDEAAAAADMTMSKMESAGGDDAGGDAAKAALLPVGNKGSTIAQSSFNLVKNIVGAGVLGLPAGIAALSDNRATLTAAFAMLGIMALLSGYCFSLLGQTCYATKTTTYGTSWAVACNPSTAWIPKSVCTTKAFIGCLAYSMILADSFSAIFRSAGLPGWISARTPTLWLVTIAVILPLCLMRSFKALAPFSMVGVAGMVYTTAFMGYRWVDGSYAPGGQYYDEIDDEFKPVFDSGSGNPVSALILVSMASSAFIAHYNAPKYFIDLKDRSVPRYNTLVGIAFGVSLSFFILAASFGFLTFGGGSNGLILNNYAVSDPLATAARVCIALSILFGYPLCFVGFRDGLLELIYSRPQSRRLLDVYTVGILLLVTFLAMMVRDLGFLLSFTGALFGAAVAYILPALIALGAQNKGFTPPSALSKAINTAVVIIGFVLMILGSVVSVLKTFTDFLDG